MEKNSAKAFACALLILRLPLTTSETTPLEPITPTKFSCSIPDASIRCSSIERSAAVGVVLNYKAKLFEKGLAESTVNRRLASIKTLCSMGRKLGICQFTLEDVKGERVLQYRDTSGISPEEYRKVLDICDRTKVNGIRDYALLKLLWDNALRRNEESLLNYGDFEPLARELTILGKGKGTQTEIIGLSTSTTNALLD